MKQHVRYFSDYYKSLNKKFTRHLKECLHSPKSESVHQLRVSIKKLKAFFHLIEYANASFHAKKSFGGFKKVFRHAAKVRNLNVQLSLLVKFEKESRIQLPGQKDKLADREKKEKK